MGKSSLISALVPHVRSRGLSVGVVSVDPSSPFSQGALLGDRIRLAEHFLDPGVFIRSMGTRGHLGGLAEATLQAVLLLDAAGKDVVFVETVGTGQSEVEVIGIADTVLLVLMPGSGDSIQALKAGIMEIPDVIAVNKMDHPAAKTMLNEVRSILALDHRPRLDAADRAHGGRARRERRPALGRRSRRTASSSSATACSRSAAAATSRQEVFAVASARARRRTSSRRSATIPSCAACSTPCSAASSTRSRPCRRSSRRCSTLATVTAPTLR